MTSEILWEPSSTAIRQTLLHRFLRTAPGTPATYEELRQWSIADLPGFWSKVWSDCGVIAHRPPDEIMGEPRMPGTEWFRGAELNFAENLWRRRRAAGARRR